MDSSSSQASLSEWMVLMLGKNAEEGGLRDTTTIQLIHALKASNGWNCYPHHRHNRHTPVRNLHATSFLKCGSLVQFHTCLLRKKSHCFQWGLPLGKDRALQPLWFMTPTINKQKPWLAQNSSSQNFYDIEHCEILCSVFQPTVCFWLYNKSQLKN